MPIAQTPEQILFALLEWGVLLLFLLLLPRISWGLFKYPMPNAYTLRHLYRLKDRWFQKARLGSEVPPRLEPPQTPFWGGCATMIAIAIEFLNLFLLAQILDVFFPSGEPIDILYLGKYYVFCLIMAVIWILAQIFIGHTCYHPSVQVGQNTHNGGEHEAPHSRVISLTNVIVDMRRLLPLWGWYVLLGIAVVGEGFLGFFRAWLLNIGEISEMGKVDTVIKNVGPIIAGLISLLIPLVGITAGVLGLISYVEPWAEYKKKVRQARQTGLVKALFSSFGAMVLRLFVCFHGQPPPLPFLYKIFPNVKKIASQCEGWQRQVRNLQERAEKIDPGRVTPPSIPDITQLEQQVKDLSQRHKNYQETCQKGIKELDSVIIDPERNDKKYDLDIKAAHVKCELYINNAKSNFDEMIGTKKSISKSLDNILPAYQKNVDFWEKFSNDKRRLLPGMSKDLALLKQRREELKGEIEEEKKDWDVLGETRKKIAELLNTLNPNEDPEIQAHLLEQESEEVKENRGRLTEAQSKLEEVDMDAIENILKVNPDIQQSNAQNTAQNAQNQVNQLKDKLNDLNLEGSRINVLTEFYGIKSKLDQEAKRLKKARSILQQLAQRLFGGRKRRNMRLHDEPKTGSLPQ